MPYLCDSNPTNICCSKRAKNDGKRNYTEIRIHPEKGTNKGLKGQFGHDGMEEPLVPLKAPESYENSDPDRPSVFVRVADPSSREWLQGLDNRLRSEIVRLGLGDSYDPAMYRSIYVEPKEEGQAGACSIKLALADIPEKKIKATEFYVIEKNEDGEDEVREGSVKDFMPGRVDNLYMDVSISKVWKVQRLWGATIYANKVAMRLGEDDTSLVIGGKTLQGDGTMKSSKRKAKPTKEAPPAPSPSASRSPSPEAAPSPEPTPAKEDPPSDDAEDEPEEPASQEEEEDVREEEVSEEEDSPEPSPEPAPKPRKRKPRTEEDGENRSRSSKHRSSRRSRKDDD